MNMTLSNYHRAMHKNAGYCTVCNAITAHDAVTATARGCMCPLCGKESLMGAEAALTDSHIEINGT